MNDLKAKLYMLAILLCLLVWGLVFVTTGNRHVEREADKAEALMNDAIMRQGLRNE